MDGNVFKEMCKRCSGGEEEGEVRQHGTGDRFGIAHGGKKARGNIPELPNTTFMVVTCRVSNGNDDETSTMQLQASYKDVRH